MAFQFGLGLIVLKVPAGRKIVLWFSERLQELISYSRASSIFIFGDNYMEHRFAFAVSSEHRILRCVVRYFWKQKINAFIAVHVIEVHLLF